jgi:serine/threonine-protein kinase
MSDWISTEEEAQGATLARHIDRLCNRFEAAWQAGKRPRIEDYLTDVPEPDRPPLLGELLALELTYRRRAGEPLSPDDYRSRFPQRGEQIGASFDRVAGLAGAGGPSTLAHAREQEPAESFAIGAEPAGRQAATSPRFRILRHHASGGLGAVFVALDTELNREVALKQILDRHADDPASRQRFLIEAEITGGLEHPGIVPVYGLGSYLDGRPYYAMRFIKGASLKEAIEDFHADSPLPTTGEGGRRPGEGASRDPATGECGRRPGERASRDPGRRSLELRKLLRRFLDVCNAIDYAHARGVLHRDIKPGNVIVGKHGETLVVDWGLAKPLGRVEPESDLGEHTLMPRSSSGSAETLPGCALGTPAYMSPEQAVGDFEHLGPRSDVYSLGATLYCLLTGKAPFEDGDVGTVLLGVKQGKFVRPRQLDPTIDPALEAICRKAMALRPDDRYPTPRALAEEIERWTADEPVTAWPEPLAVRARRWARRHRTTVTAAAAAVLVALAGAGVVLAVQTRSNSDLKAANLRLKSANARTSQANTELQAANLRERAARDLAQRRFDLARQAIEQYYTGASEDVLLKQPELKALRTRLMNTSLGFYKKLQAELERSDDPATQVELAAAYARVAEIVEQVGSEAEALGAYGSAVALCESQVQVDPSAAGPLRNLATILEKLGRLEARIAGGEPRGLRTLERALALREAIAKENAGEADDRRAMAASHRMISVGHSNLGHGALALRSVERAKAIAERPVSDHPDAAAFRYELAEIYSRLARDQQGAGRPAEAFRSQGDAVALLERLAAEHPDSMDYRQSLASALSSAGNLRTDAGRPAEALPFFQRALQIRQRLAAEYPTVTEQQYLLGRLHMFIGKALAVLGRAGEAIEPLERAGALFERLLADHPDFAGYAEDLAYAELNIANAQKDLGKKAEARRALEHAAELLERGSTIPAIYNLACVKSRLSELAPSDPAGRTQGAGAGREAHAERAIAALRRAVASGFRELDLIRTDPDLDPLRARQDFQMLLLDLALPNEPFAPDR